MEFINGSCRPSFQWSDRKFLWRRCLIGNERMTDWHIHTAQWRFLLCRNSHFSGSGVESQDLKTHGFDTYQDSQPMRKKFCRKSAT